MVCVVVYHQRWGSWVNLAEEDTNTDASLALMGCEMLGSDRVVGTEPRFQPSIANMRICRIATTLVVSVDARDQPITGGVVAHASTIGMSLRDLTISGRTHSAGRPHVD